MNRIAAGLRELSEGLRARHAEQGWAPLWSLLYLGFLFMLIRPQMKRAKEQRAMVAALNKGDEVLTNGGLLGRIDDISEQFVSLEIASGVVVKMRRDAVSAVLPKGTLKSA